MTLCGFSSGSAGASIRQSDRSRKLFGRRLDLLADKKHNRSKFFLSTQLENERKRRLVLEQDDEDYIPNPPMTSTARGASSLGASVVGGLLFRAILSSHSWVMAYQLVGFVPPPDRGRRSAASRGRIELPCELPEPISGTLTKIGKPIGGGGHGNVYQGIWDQPGAEAKQVVIKCLTLREETRSEFIERVN